MSKIFPLRSKPAAEQTPLSDVAYSNLRYAILEGQIPPGTRLHELELCRTLKMGRSPIREALLRLKADGLIESLPDAKFCVKYHTLEDMEEEYRLRAVLESLAVRLACERGFPDSRLDEMQHCCRLMEGADKKGDDRALGLADLEFHRILVSLCRSPRLETVIRSSHLSMFGWERRLKDAGWLAQSRRELLEHRQMVKLLRQRDGEKTAQLLERSFGRAFETIRKAALAGKDLGRLVKGADIVGEIGLAPRRRRAN
ncbi:MAG: GntR family transcriptional regulator [Verrucomicrobia bacterium]|nr:GntR family transcriptional regulator [Verrucomicrobiota bacterium]